MAAGGRQSSPVSGPCARGGQAARNARPIGSARSGVIDPSLARPSTLFFFLSTPRDAGDLPCPTKGTAIEDHDDEDQSTLERGAVGARQECYGEPELH